VSLPSTRVCKALLRIVADQKCEVIHCRTNKVLGLKGHWARTPAICQLVGIADRSVVNCLTRTLIEAQLAKQDDTNRRPSTTTLTAELPATGMTFAETSPWSMDLSITRRPPTTWHRLVGPGCIAGAQLRKAGPASSFS